MFRSLLCSPLLLRFHADAARPCKINTRWAAVEDWITAVYLLVAVPYYPVPCTQKPALASSHGDTGGWCHSWALNTHMLLPASVSGDFSSHSFSAFFDSGGEQTLINDQLQSPLPATVLNGQSLTSITHKTKLLKLVLKSSQHKFILFFVFHSLNTTTVLGVPWLAPPKYWLGWSGNVSERRRFGCLFPRDKNPDRQKMDGWIQLNASTNGNTTVCKTACVAVGTEAPAPKAGGGSATESGEPLWAGQRPL